MALGTRVTPTKVGILVLRHNAVGIQLSPFLVAGESEGGVYVMENLAARLHLQMDIF